MGKSEQAPKLSQHVATDDVSISTKAPLRAGGGAASTPAGKQPRYSYKFGSFPQMDRFQRLVSDPLGVLKSGYISEREVLCVTRDAVVIRDKYPKAKHHYLVLSRDRRLVSVYDLEKQDGQILVEMGRLAGLVVQAVLQGI